jgi:hypothetical protein
MSQTEGRITLALQAYQQGRFSSLRAAARAYNVPHTTLTRRNHGTTYRANSTSPNLKLTQTEETALIEWILSLDTRGIPPTQILVQQMAELLLKERVQNASIGQTTLGQRWVYRFINRHPEIKSRYSRKYDYQRAKCEDPEVIQAWFRLVQNTVAKYGILVEDIYNFDETGFQMGVISTAKVITAAEKDRTVSIQPGNREWVTAIESINSTGWVLPPMIILKGVMHQKSWYEAIPDNWRIGVSENGWTTDELGLTWLKEVFNKHTQDRTVGTYRLLILDGHGSHVTGAFDQYAKQNSIIVLCMPPHSSHILQPLDVSCFAVLKQRYGRAVEAQMRVGINHVDKDDFLTLYQEIRPAVFGSGTIQSGFRATGIVPFDPDQVLSELHVQVQTQTPLPLPRVPTQVLCPWDPETPHNIAELQLQTRAVQQLIRYRTQSPPTPAVQAVNQLVKGCQMAMHNATILAAENRQLRAANAKVQKKRAKKTVFVSRGGTLTAQEVLESQNKAVIHNNVRIQVVETPSRTVSTRAPPKCSVCKSLEHTARTCLER